MLCPAKINLGLKVLYKRPDDYHEIESIFLKLNWGDEIEFASNSLGVIRLFSKNELHPSKKILFEEVSERGDFSKNILYKTFEKAKQLKSNLEGIDVHLIKRIPPGGGLGGGSSNAGLLLAHIFKDSQVHGSAILKLASKIGADVPFFMGKGNAHISGIGEIINPIEVATGRGILAIPPESINTKESYKSLKKPLQTGMGQKSWNLLDGDSVPALKAGNWSKLQEKFENDFEKYAFSVYPEVGALKQDFYAQGCSFSSMTGTGSCVYGFVNDLHISKNIISLMSKKYLNHYFIQFSF